jgi:FkbM family methyltransferase
LLHAVSTEAPLHPQSALPHPYVVKRTVSGMPLQLYIGTEGGRLWYDSSEIRRLGGRYEVAELAVCREKQMPRRGDVVFDIGAHNGVFSLWFAAEVGPAGHVYAIEPVRENAAVIERNAALNGVQNISVLHAAVGDHGAEVSFNLDSCTVIRPDDAAGPSAPSLPPVSVSQVTLDALALPAPALLKIDVEGYEGAVLRGAQRVLEATPNLLIELHPQFSLDWFGEDANDVLALIDWSCYEAWGLLPQHGYELRRWTPDTEIVADEGRNSWIFARAAS